MFSPRLTFQTGCHTGSEGTPFGIGPHIVPGGVHAYPTSIFKHHTAAHIFFPVTGMIFAVIFDSDFIFRICKIKEQFAADIRIRLSWHLLDIELRIDLRHRQSIGQQHQSQFTFPNRIRILFHQDQSPAQLRSAGWHPSPGLSNLLVYRMTRITKIAQRHPPLITVSSHESIPQQHQRSELRTSRIHQPCRIRGNARDAIKMHESHGITPKYAPHSCDSSAGFLRISDHYQLVMIQPIWHVDTQQFQCGAQRENQRRGDTRLKFAAANQCLRLNAQQSDRGRFDAPSTSLRQKPRPSMLNRVHSHTFDASLPPSSPKAMTDNVVKRCGYPHTAVRSRAPTA
ncbi:hypothetical protein DSM100238_0452 [Bifidobacterium apri]|uniref:Uncharacterized protein n=1 Tax=Bifidobacterium apri TaxID=1769423 RepID=A0A6A2VID9_9BIFI|nr:hypothetical protein DSM100238_0452 [Bifidobacterium apri]